MSQAGATMRRAGVDKVATMGWSELDGRPCEASTQRAAEHALVHTTRSRRKGASLRAWLLFGAFVAAVMTALALGPKAQPLGMPPSAAGTTAVESDMTVPPPLYNACRMMTWLLHCELDRGR